MSLQPFRCRSDKCSATQGMAIFHAEPLGVTPEEKLKPVDGCPNCGSTDPSEVKRLALIHLLLPATKETCTHPGSNGKYWAYACDRHKTTKRQPMCTDVPSAVTCPECLAAIAAMPVASDDE